MLDFLMMPTTAFSTQFLGSYNFLQILPAVLDTEIPIEQQTVTIQLCATINPQRNTRETRLRYVTKLAV